MFSNVISALLHITGNMLFLQCLSDFLGYPLNCLIAVFYDSHSIPAFVAFLDIKVTDLIGNIWRDAAVDRSSRAECDCYYADIFPVVHFL